MKIFELGKHRLGFGDSSKTEDVAELMGETRADLFLTDPPYGVSYIEKNAAVHGGIVLNAIGKKIGEFVTQTLSSVSRKAAVNLIDSLKDFGFYGFTVSGISLSMRDCGSLPEKKKIIKEADLRVLKIEENFNWKIILPKWLNLYDKLL